MFCDYLLCSSRYLKKQRRKRRGEIPFLGCPYLVGGALVFSQPCQLPLMAALSSAALSATQFSITVKQLKLIWQSTEQNDLSYVMTVGLPSRGRSTSTGTDLHT